MKQQIIIGKNGNQPFTIADPNVSRLHAYLFVDESGKMEIVDNKSTNGTYIYNGREFVRLYPNQTYSVTLDTMIQLGPDTRFHVRRLLPESPKTRIAPQVNNHAPAQAPSLRRDPAPTKKIKRVDISHLRRISEEYNKQRMNLESKSGMINGLRSCSIIVTLLAGSAPTFLPKVLSGSEETETLAKVAGIVGGIILMAILLLIINRYNKKIIERRTANDKDYSIKYVCPECKVSFRGKIYENILAERMCPRCKTEFYERQ
ncbi:MAG: FHA domain-containing protein [Candidatus Amulumruptor caecigallinarius]|nr:FHA domain-containing protein [Candidatus Amulumruptor caecigallinarius]